VLKGGKFPDKSTPGSAGYDVYSNADIIIKAGSKAGIPLGIKLQCEPDTYFRLADRGGNAANRDLHVVAGVIDSDYRGEVVAVIRNNGKNSIKITKGFKIAQIIPTLIKDAKLEKTSVKELSTTKRGDKGGVNEKYKSSEMQT
jgi:dUTP pyrophosphatase